MQNVAGQPVVSVRTLNSEVPPDLEKIVLKALRTDPAKRYQDAGAMGYDLEYFLYHKGYGPTIQTLERYQRDLFPELYLNDGGTVKPSSVLKDDLSISLSILHPPTSGK